MLCILHLHGASLIPNGCNPNPDPKLRLLPSVWTTTQCLNNTLDQVKKSYHCSFGSELLYSFVDVNDFIVHSYWIAVHYVLYPLSSALDWGGVSREFFELLCVELEGPLSTHFQWYTVIAAPIRPVSGACKCLSETWEAFYLVERPNCCNIALSSLATV